MWIGAGFEFQKVEVRRGLKKVSVEGGDVQTAQQEAGGDLNSNSAPCI